MRAATYAAFLVFAALLAGCGSKTDDAWLGYGEGDAAFVPGARHVQD